MERLFKLFNNAGKELFLVGGAVRDHILRGIPLKDIEDWDFGTDALPEESIEILEKDGRKVWTLGIAFGTIEGENFQITTFRKEIYRSLSRFPEVEFGQDLQTDLERRDFTINAMALSPKGLIDPFDGVTDWGKGILRTPMDPHLTFRDDPLRMLRCFRFVAKFGLEPDSYTMEAIRRKRGLINSISRERWLMEMDKLLLGKHLVKALELMKESGLLEQMLPELVDLEGISQGEFHSKDAWLHSLKVAAAIEATPDLRWAGLLHDIGKGKTKSVSKGGVHFYRHEEVGAEMWLEIANRFKMSSERTAHIEKLIRLHMRPNVYETSEWSDSAVRRLRRELGDEMYDVLALSRADITSQNPERVVAAISKINELRDRLETVPEFLAKSTVLPKGTGELVMRELNLSPGPKVGEVKKRVEEEVVDGRLEPTLEAIESWLKKREL